MKQTFFIILSAATLLSGCTTGTPKPDAHPATENAVPDGQQGLDANGAPVVTVDYMAEGNRLLAESADSDSVDYQAIHDAFSKAAEQTPDSIPANFNKALAASKLGKTSEAREAYQTVLKLDPNFKGAVYNLARVEVENQSAESAIELYESYLERNPEDMSATNNLATLQVELDKHEEAIKLSQKVLLQDPENIQAYKNLSRSYFRQGQYKQSLLLSTNALRLDEKDPGIHNDLGVTYLELNNEPAAIASFKKALELDEKNLPSNLNLGQIALKSGDFYLAQECFDRILSVEPGHTEAMLGLAIALRGQLDIEGATEAYVKALEVHPDNPGIVWNFAILQHNFTGDFDKALQLYEQYVKLVADDSAAQELARQQIIKLDSDKAALAEAKRLDEERRLAEEARIKQMEAAKKPLLALISEAEKLATDSEGKVSADVIENLTLLVEQARQIIEFEDLDLMQEIFEYLNATVEDVKAQSPA